VTSVKSSETENLKHTQLHGHRVAYRLEGSGPLIVLVHGITSSSATWERVVPALAERYTVIAPDLLGHGQSAKPRGDYSLGAYASGLRDLLVALGHERATFVGHSLGGGVAMQLSYQFPELCERLVLVDSGGLGREVSLLLRSATLPGSEFVLPVLAQPRLLNAGRSVGRLLNGLGIGIRTDLDQLARGHASLADREAREAFVHTLRSIVEWRENPEYRFVSERADNAVRKYGVTSIALLARHPG
jgi:pimeloyl-ACP methyl ester carboxylesterase